MPIAIGIREQRRCETTLFLFLEIAHHSTVASFSAKRFERA